MTVEIFSPDKRTVCAKRVVQAGNLNFNKIYLLPIPSSKDGVHINGTDLQLLDIAAVSGDAIICYGIPDEIYGTFVKRGVSVYDAERDEDFLVRNAVLTALGVIGDIITEKNKSPEEVSFGIIGYGRIGKVLLKYLYFLGATPTVYTTRDSVLVELGSIGVNAKLLSESDLSDMDVIINTAPTHILDKEDTERLIAAGTTVFDLASGDNFGLCQAVVKPMSVPGKVYPESAGKSYGEMAIKYFSNTK